MAKSENMAGSNLRSFPASSMQHQAMLWRSLGAWDEAQRPPALWPWLGHAGSLTGKLRTTVGAAFHVQVLHEYATQLAAEDARLLHTLPGTAAHAREVYLCGTVPCVYARTFATAEAAYWLDQLAARPLGDRVFAAAGTERLPIQVACLDSSAELYQAALQHRAEKPAQLWARRSVLVAGGRRLLIYECFLEASPH